MYWFCWARRPALPPGKHGTRSCLNGTERRTPNGPSGASSQLHDLRLLCPHRHFRLLPFQPLSLEDMERVLERVLGSQTCVFIIW